MNVRSPVSRRLPLLRLLGLMATVLASWAPVHLNAQPNAESHPAVLGQLKMLDGSSLQGYLENMDAESAEVHWRHPDLDQPIRVRTSHLAWIRFQLASPGAEQYPTHRFQFHNGDDVYGRLIALDSRNVTLTSRMSGLVKANKNTIRSINRLPGKFSVIYKGPSSLDGWSLGKRRGKPGNQSVGWYYREGAFVSQQPGTSGRDFRLTQSSTLDFDLSWKGYFNLVVALYTDVIDQVNFGSPAYKFYFGRGFVNLSRSKPRSSPATLGRASLPNMLKTDEMNVQIRVNKKQSTLVLRIDGELIGSWKEQDGFVAQGTGLLFFNQQKGHGVSIRNLCVTTWDGAQEVSEVNHTATDNDWLYLVNGDRVAGQLIRIADQHATLATHTTEFIIPLSRITQTFFASAAQSPPGEKPDMVRIYLASGGSVAMALNQWSSKTIIGNSLNFGRVVLPTHTIRKVRFNLHQQPELEAEPEAWDETIWDDPQ